MRSSKLHDMFNTMGLIALFSVLMLSAVWAGLVLAGHDSYAMIPMFGIFAQFLYQVAVECKKLRSIVEDVDSILEPEKEQDIKAPDVFKKEFEW